MKKLNIRKESNDGVEVLDSVLDKCSTSLNTLDIGMYPDWPEWNEEPPAENIDLSIVKQKPGINNFDCFLIVRKNNSLSYLMHTFTGFQHLSINSDKTRKELKENESLSEKLWGIYSFITSETLISFIKYKISIPSGEVVLNVEPLLYMMLLSSIRRKMEPTCGQLQWNMEYWIVKNKQEYAKWNLY